MPPDPSLIALVRCSNGTKKNYHGLCRRTPSVAIQARLNKRDLFLYCKECSIPIILLGRYDVVDFDETLEKVIVSQVMKT